MPLDSDGLIADITEVLQSFPSSPADAAQRLALAYDTYCQGGLFGASAAVFTGTEKDKLAAILLPAMLPAIGNPVTLATAWSAGVTAFWMAPPIAVAGAQVGVVTAIPGAVALIPALTAVFLNVANTAPTCAVGMGTALHAATLTTMASVAPPPGTVVTFL